MLFEYFPLSKINSVPNGETAFRRDPSRNVLMVTSWKQDLETDRETAEAIVKKARSFAQELADIIGNAGLNDGLTPVQRLGYGNYGELLLTFLLVAQLSFLISLSRWFARFDIY